MIGTMSDTKTRDYSDKGGELLRDSILSRIQRKEFSPNNFNGKLMDLGIPVSRVHSVLVEPAPITSPLARSELYLIDLLAENRLTLGTLFLQLYYSGMKSPSPNMSSQQIESAKDKLREIDYRVKHMSLWNEASLHSPYFMGIEKSIGEDDRDYAIGILTQFLDGNTHDLDMLAINRRASRIEEQLMDDRFLTSQMRDKLEKEKEDLLTKKTQIVDSILRTINDFAVTGTDTISKSKHRPLFDSTLVTDKKFYETKSLEYFNHAYEWHCKVKPDPSVKLRNMLENFDKSMGLLVGRLSDRDKFIYAQGDEFLHHYQARLDVRDKNDVMRSAVFDADHACFNRLERSRSKILLSPLLDLSYEDKQEYLDGADLDLVERLKKAGEDTLSNARLAYMKDRDKARLDFDLIAINEALCIIGRAAFDDKKNKRYTFSRHNVSANYNNPNINYRFPENIRGAVYLGAYPSRKTISIVTGNLNTLVQRMVDGETPYGLLRVEEIDSLKRIQDILGKFSIPDTPGKTDTQTRY